MKSALTLLLITIVASFAFGQNAPDKTDPFQHPYANPKDDPKLPRVLIIGDSISIGYTPRVRKLLDGVANVHRPKTNCRWSAFGAENIEEWIGDSEWDAIHFNFGLWDWYGWSQEVKATPESYGKNLESIVKKLKAKTDAELIFAMTTPPCVAAEKKAKIVISEAQAGAFNQAARAVMQKHGVTINNLYHPVLKERERFQKGPDDVHYTEDGCDFLAARVAWKVREILKLPVSAVATTPAKITDSPIQLKEIEGRSWLINPEGKPFFAHGITHVSNKKAGLDFEQFSKACKELGFNAYGYGCPPELRGDMPYVESWNHLVPISYYRGKNAVEFVDIFDPKVQATLEAGVKFSCLKSRSNPNCIGYTWTDLGSWPLDNPSGTNWVEFTRNLPAESPGRKAYDKFLSTWKSDGGEDDANARDLAFLRLIAREYFRVVGEANQKYAPNQLIFGDRFAFNTIVPEVVEEMLSYVDAIAIQPPFQGGFPKEKYDEIHALTGKPILLCDFAVRFKDGDKDIRSWKPAANSVEAGKQYADYIRAALDTKYIIGAFWCNPVDTSKGFGNPGVKQGFFGDEMSMRPGLAEAVKKVNAFRDDVTPEG